MKTHELKTDPKMFEEVWRGWKKFEIRKDDRGFAFGDELLLRETLFTGEEMAGGSPLEYSGRQMVVYITYILRGPVYGLGEGWVIMSIFPFTTSKRER